MPDVACPRSTCPLCPGQRPPTTVIDEGIQEERGCHFPRGNGTHSWMLGLLMAFWAPDEPPYIHRSRFLTGLFSLVALVITTYHTLSIITTVVVRKLSEIRVPEPEARWRWPQAVSPFLTELDKESLEWSASFNAFDPEIQRLVHDKGKLTTSSPTTHVSNGSTGATIEQTCWQACAMLACPKVGYLSWGDITRLPLISPTDAVRWGCDVMHLFLMFDEHSDTASPDEVWEQAPIQVDAICRPTKPRPEGEWVGGEFARQ